MPVALAAARLRLYVCVKRKSSYLQGEIAVKTIVPVPEDQVKLLAGFWRSRQELVRTEAIPYQWEALNDAIPDVEPSHAIQNLRVAAGDATGTHRGFVFQDSDVAKWLEAVGHILQQGRDPALETKADSVIELLERVQQADGYLNSYYQVNKPDERWSNLRDDHELYCAGHLIEAAVAYSNATGKDAILRVARRLADHLWDRFGPAPEKIPGYSGHPEIELALTKLYAATQERRYLDLARFFVDERGRQPNFFIEEAKHRNDTRPYHPEYAQNHLPVREQDTAEGHAVRAMYLFSGAADVACEFDDLSLKEALTGLWDNVTQKRMYVTGGVGSSAWGEAFTLDYDLPGDRAYAETCAAIGLVFWGQRMLRLDGDGKYADVIERALYNGVLSGMSFDAQRYFYVNPLEVWPEAAARRHDMHAVKVERQPWFGCACCPPNLSRLLASLSGYVYGMDPGGDGLFVHL